MIIRKRKGREWLLAGLLLLASRFLLVGCNSDPSADRTSATGDATAPRPNIIYIIADDLGYGDLGSFGQDSIRTPHLDRMAAEGLRLTQHYAGSTVCAPSRSVLMTGYHSGRTQIRGNREIRPIGQYPLAFGTPTIPLLLQEQGYVNGGFGKWGLGYPGSEGQPSNQGFDEFFGFLCQRRAHFFYPEFLFHDVRGEELRRVVQPGNRVRHEGGGPGSGPPAERGIYSGDSIHEQAMDFLMRHHDRPFFMFLPVQVPHASMTIPDEWLELYLDEQGNSVFDENPFGGGHYTEQSFPKAAYAAMVTYLDAQVGEIMHKLHELGIAENTLVIFTSDNGSHSEGGYHYSMLDSNAPLRGGKRDLYEGGIRVPTLAWWPGHIPAGSVSAHISGFQDMLPTFAELAGAVPPPGIDGISMVPVLMGREQEQPTHPYLYWEFHELGGRQAVRRGDWKAVRLQARTPGQARTELYNLAEDIGEQHNLADRYPEVVEEMHSIMQQAHVSSHVFPFFD